MMAPSALLGTVCLTLVLTGSLVDSRAKRSKRQAFDPFSDPFGPGAGAGSCKPIQAPTNGNIDCGDNIPFYTCTARCDDGYKFETNDNIIVRECDSSSGEYFPLTGESLAPGEKPTLPICERK
ncbi:uncharacterized protein LOC110463683 [Mizuhopecten yessoensis]|uniref:uncharacterized protein LOC110463683 n=1 Tax=Mizuhopecten yessoensis TaxID=6573 RepID=UPI000B45A8C8|nr:uncharacterized protein LOC110463683 [Mizuhopecten yessoensis]